MAWSLPLALVLVLAGDYPQLGVVPCSGRVFGRCELARRLTLELQSAAVWVCIAQHESSFDTAAVGRLNGDGSADHGLLQISDKYWCGPHGGCSLPCSSLTDDDISDDLECALKIYAEHQRLFGQGFQAWTVFPLYCDGPHVSKYVAGCFQNDTDFIEKPLNSTEKPLNTTTFDIEKLLPITTTTTEAVTTATSTTTTRTTTTVSTTTARTTTAWTTTARTTPARTTTVRTTPARTTTVRTTPARITTVRTSITTPKISLPVTKKAIFKLPPLKPLKPLKGSSLRRVFSFGTALSTTTPLKNSHVVLSFPHFLSADKSFSEGVIGMNPDPDLHQIYLDIEPLTGTPLAGGKRVQFNMFVRKLPNVPSTNKITTNLIPILWVDEGLDMPDEYIQEMKETLFDVLDILDVVKWTLIGVGTGVTIISLCMMIYYICKAKNVKTV